mmetsp:Transcript_15033/g.36087  ORF Transcript_15033/g.36087 Transcript_15033/m.36087 type:complete len:229 (-) Transcript_15033:834-1520(-)
MSYDRGPTAGVGWANSKQTAMSVCKANLYKHQTYLTRRIGLYDHQTFRLTPKYQKASAKRGQFMIDSCFDLLRADILNIDLCLRALRNAKYAFRFRLLGQPVLFEPFYRLAPALPVTDDWRKSQILFRRLYVEPSMHCEYCDVELIQFHGHPQQLPYQLAYHGDEHEQALREMGLGPQRPEPHRHDGQVELLPKDQVLFATGMGLPVRDDVELPEGRTVRIQRLLRNY